MALRFGLRPARRRLPLLEFLLLLHVTLPQLLRLLLVLLFSLLLRRLVGLLLIEALVVVLLLLLELLPFLVLLLLKLLLLLLILLICLRVPRVRSCGALHRREVLDVRRGGGTAVVFRPVLFSRRSRSTTIGPSAICRRMIRRSRLARGYGSCLELARSGRRGNRRLALIY